MREEPTTNRHVAQGLTWACAGKLRVVVRIFMWFAQGLLPLRSLDLKTIIVIPRTTSPIKLNSIFPTDTTPMTDSIITKEPDRYLWTSTYNTIPECLTLIHGGQMDINLLQSPGMYIFHMSTDAQT